MKRRPLPLARPTPEKRRLGCRHESACVSDAAQAGWRGLACPSDAACFEQQSPLEARADLESLAGLVRAIGGMPLGESVRLMEHGE